ncbi:MAG: Mov34/MPN/PAD-1 family protein [Deltaproteobacteria bacterium]|nr:Mov34/MPN/PAD-1 family protein [Deltaproteobacteria bacterium]
MNDGSVRKLQISKQAMAELDAHACATYPDECCGMIIERNGQEEVVRITNIQNELHARDAIQFPRTAATAYAMRYQEVEPIFEAAYKGHIRLHAVYHSHPEHDAYFSEEDRAAALGWIDDPSYAAAGQIVLSIRNRAVVGAKGFGWDETNQTYLEIPLAIV